MNNRTNMINMGKHIAELRKKKNYTQKNLGDILDVSDKTVSKWEKGVAAPDITILHSLATTLDVTIEELLSGEEVEKIDTIEAMDIYSNITKGKLIKSFIIFIVIFSLCIFFVFRIEDYYSWHLQDISTDGNDIISRGFLLSNNEKSKILINEIGMLDKNTISVKYFTIQLKNKNEIIYNRDYSLDGFTSFDELLKECIISVELNKKVSKDDLILDIIIKDDNDDKKLYSYEFE